MSQQPHPAILHADWALLPQGWARDVRIALDASGLIASITHGSIPDDAERLHGAVAPGMPNLHSHAFQRIFAGRTEYSSGGADTFWTWREAMYRAANRLDPSLLNAVAQYVFAAMLKAGYTSVAEFHYLHAAPGGDPYQPDNAMAAALIEAAEAVGIGLTLLPVLYDRRGFDSGDLLAEQRRFHIGLDGILGWMEASPGSPLMRWGIAPHSLRAVAPEGLAAAIDLVTHIDPLAPIHLHIAEQTAEVEGFAAAYGSGPVTWLLDHQPVDRRWCLVHATHATADELKAVAATGAVIGLCPVTEANLGDGIFGLPAFLEAGGRFGIGSDSNVSIDPFEELRLLEYGQRLAHMRRNIGGGGPPGHTGTALWQAAARNGALALGQNVGALTVGARADLITLSLSPEMEAQPPDYWLDTAIFASTTHQVRDVMVGGRWRVRDGRHADHDMIEIGYRAALKTLDL